MTKELTKFEQLCEQNVSKYTEKKNGLTYLSWTYAWKEFKKNYPQATYHVTHWDGAPYYYDENLGYMCETTVDNGDGTVHSMWLPVMDGANKAQKAVPYTYKVKKYEDRQWTGKYEEKTVEPATMFDINTTIMRCLVKNIAMFGLGLYIYSGEDLPELSEITIEKNNQARVEEMKKRIRAMIDKLPPETDTTEFTDWEKSDDVEKLKAFGIYLKKLLG